MGEAKTKSSTNGLLFREKFGYALGDTGGVLAFGVVSSFLQMYYTDVLHISLAKITILMLVARIWDAINDPIWGRFIDSRKPTKYGRFRPYILWLSFPLAISFILMFIKIPGLSENQYLIYAYITYIFYGMMYTGTNIPYGSLASVMTEDEVERSSLSVARSFGAGIGSLPGQILLPLFVYSVAVDTGVKYLDANKMLGAVILLSGFALIIYFVSFKLVREHVVLPPKQEKGKMSDSMKALLRNKPFIVLCLASMMLIASSMYTQTIYNFLFKNYYNKPELFSLVTVFTYIPMLALMPIMGKLVRRFGKKELCAYGMLFAAFINLVMYIIKIDNPMVFLFFCLFAGFGISFFTLEVWALVADIIDYHELRTNRREEGTGFACFSFSRKLGQTIAGTGASIGLALIGYNTAANAVIQTDSVIQKMYDISTLVPVGMYFLMYVLLRVFYPLGKKELAEMSEALKAQRKQNQAV